jgi:hypothetical protein
MINLRMNLNIPRTSFLKYFPFTYQKHAAAATLYIYIYIYIYIKSKYIGFISREGNHSLFYLHEIELLIISFRNFGDFESLSCF